MFKLYTKYVIEIHTSISHTKIYRRLPPPLKCRWCGLSEENRGDFKVALLEPLFGEGLGKEPGGNDYPCVLTSKRGQRAGANGSRGDRNGERRYLRYLCLTSNNVAEKVTIPSGVGFGHKRRIGTLGSCKRGIDTMMSMMPRSTVVPGGGGGDWRGLAKEGRGGSNSEVRQHIR